MSIMRAQLPRELQANGGITQVRQPYFLGKVVRAVTKPIKKIVKSPVGKAAALYGLGTMMGGMPAFGGAGGSFMGRLKNPALLKNLITPSGWSGGNVLNSLLRKNIAEEGAKKAVWGSFSPFKVAALGATALPFAAPKVDETETLAEEVTDRGKFNFDFAEMRKDIAQAVRGGNYDEFKSVLDKYDLVEGVDINKWGDLKTGTLAKDGGRIGYSRGKGVDSIPRDQMKEIEGQRAGPQWWWDRVQHLEFLGYSPDQASQIASDDDAYFQIVGGPKMAQGGRIKAQEGGIMDLGGMEKDYRNTGGFVEIGGEEKADDVPARLSRNEFVFTADAVRSAGGGNIDQGAKIMENVMKNLEAGGQISEESQGMGGAQEMFDVSERLSEVV